MTDKACPLLLSSIIGTRIKDDEEGNRLVASAACPRERCQWWIEDYDGDSGDCSIAIIARDI